METKKYLCLTAIVLAMVACKKPGDLSVPVTGVLVSPSVLILTEGEEGTLVAEVHPSNADNPAVSWRSSDNTVATVSAEGLVKAIAPGESSVTITTEDGGFESVCRVTVLNSVIPISGINLDRTALDLVVEDKVQLTATVIPADATNPKISWNSSDPSIASVEGGMVTALSPGSTTVSVITEDGGLTATCSVKVSPKVIPVASVSLDKISLTLVVGDKIRLAATVLPENATDPSVKWSTGDQTVATVDNGNVTAVGTGSTTVTVTTTDGGHTASCSVTVIQSTRAIRYTTTDGVPIQVSFPEAIGKLVSNSYVDGVGTLVFEDEVTEIGQNAFLSCNTLSSVTLPASLISIGKSAFSSCRSLSAIEVPASVSSIAEGAFLGCIALERFSGTFATADGRCLIQEGRLLAVAPGGMETFTVPSSVTALTPLVFSSCTSLKGILLPVGLQELAPGAFRGCSALKRIELPSKISFIPSSAFEDCYQLSEVELPAELVNIGQYAFLSCRSLKSVVLPSKVEVLGDDCFRSCSTMTEIDLPASLVRIGNNAFYDCRSLFSVRIQAATPPQLGSNAFYEVPTICSFYVPAGSIEAYKSSDWANYNGRIVPQL